VSDLDACDVRYRIEFARSPVKRDTEITSARLDRSSPGESTHRPLHERSHTERPEQKGDDYERDDHYTQ
jgi:hypothetical protein